jgi:anti-sigma factor RsiW
VLGAAVAVWIGAPAIVASDGARPLSNVARAAYRTFAEGRMRPVEAATSDPDRLNKWFVAQLGAATPVPDLSESGLALLGGRIVPGAFSPAGVLLYENPGHERIALAIEMADAPPETAIGFDEGGGVLCAFWTGAGHSYAIVGRVSRARLSELARLVRERRQGN